MTFFINFRSILGIKVALSDKVFKESFIPGAIIPPLAGFFAKFYIFKAVIEQSMFFLAVVGLLSTVVAAFYYLRIIKIIYFDEEKEKYDEDHSLWLKFSLTFSTILILLYFIFPSQLVDVVSRINII